MNTRNFILIVVVCFMMIPKVLALSLGQMTWNLNMSELKDIGVSIRAYKFDYLCYGTAHELLVSIPERFHKKKFVAAVLSLVENEDVYLDINLIVGPTDETIHENKSFHGASFCLSENKWEDAKLVLIYGPPGHITDLVEIRRISELIENNDS